MGSHLDESWEQKQVHDDGKIFLNLQANSASTDFVFESNLPVKPLKLQHEKIDQYMDVTVEFTVTGWYLKNDDAEEKKYGLTLKVKKIHWGEEKKVVKKKKTEDDEVRAIH